MSCLPVIDAPANGCKRRFFPVAVHPGEGLLTERTADARACRYELVLMPQSGRTGGASTVVIPEWAAFAQNVAYHLLVGQKAERGRNKSLQRASPSSDHRGCPR